MHRDVFMNGILLREDTSIKRDYCWAKGVLLIHFKYKAYTSEGGPPEDVFIVHTYFLGLRVGTKVLDHGHIGYMDYTTEMKGNA